MSVSQLQALSVSALSKSIDLSRVSTVLLDADGTLFPSEEPAFAASAVVTQEFAQRFGLAGDFSAEKLRLNTTGQNFRTTSAELLRRAGVAAEAAELEDWIAQEKRVVSRYLAEVLTPREDVTTALQALHDRYRLAAVSSSALTRLDACFRASGIQALIPTPVRFSAEDSLPRPVSKPDPEIYRFALAELGIQAQDAIAIEDSATGAASAVAAGIATIGMLQFVPPAEQALRRRQLRQAGCRYLATSWDELTVAIAMSGDFG